MALQIATINDVITKEMLEATKAQLQANLAQKGPSAALPRRAPSNIPAEQLKAINTFMELSYANGDWLGFAQSIDQVAGLGVPISDLTTTRSIVAQCLGVPQDTEAIVPKVCAQINKFPNFGDLYLGFAGLKFAALQIDTAIELLELAALCPQYSKYTYDILKEKFTLFRPQWKSSVNYFIRYTRAANFDRLSEGVDPELVEKVRPIAQQIRENPGDVFTIWQHNPALREWGEKADDRCHKLAIAYPVSEVPNVYPITSLDPAVTTQILGYLDLPSILNLRSTCGELCNEVAASLVWKKLFEEDTGVKFDSLPYYIRDIPFAAFSGFRSVLIMCRDLCGDSNFGIVDTTAFSKGWLKSADEIIESSRHLYPGSTWQSLSVISFLYRIQALACIDLTGRVFDYLIDNCPGFLHLIIRLMGETNPIALTCCLQTIMCAICSKSSKRPEILAAFDHWRLAPSMTKFGLVRQGPFSLPAHSLYALINGAKLMDVEHITYNLKMDLDTPTSYEKPFSSDDFDGVWWITTTNVNLVSAEKVAELICCNLKWVKEEDGTVSIKGTAVNRHGQEAEIIGQTTEKVEQMGFQYNSSEENWIFDGSMVPMGCGGVASDANDVAEPGAWNPVCSFFMWRDNRPATPEFVASAIETVKATSSSFKLPAWFDIDLMAQSLGPMMALRYGMLYTNLASSFAPHNVIELNSIPYEVPDIAEHAQNPAMPAIIARLRQDPSETNEAFQARCNIFSGAFSWGASQRFDAIKPTYMHELPEDLQTIVDALKITYASLPHEVLVAAGVVDPNDPTRRTAQAVLLSLDNDFETTIRKIYSSKMVAWFQNSKENLEASAVVLDAIIRTGLSGPATLTALDFDNDSPINQIYHKWTSRLVYAHPVLNSADPPFSFEELVVSFGLLLSPQFDDSANEEAAAFGDEDNFESEDATNQIFSDALKRQSRRDTSSTVTTIAIVGAAAIATIAIGVGAFLLGRRLNND